MIRLFTEHTGHALRSETAARTNIRRTQMVSSQQALIRLEPSGFNDPLEKHPGAVLDRSAKYLFWRSFLVHNTIVEEADLGCDFFCKAHLMRRQQHGHALLSQVAHNVQHF